MTIRIALFSLFVAAAFAIALQTQAQTPLDAPSPSAEKQWVAVAKGRVDVEGGLVQVAAPRDGIIREVRVEEGDTVSKGDVLAVQDDEAAKLDVAEASAAFEQAKAAMPLLENRLAAAKRDAARLETLVKAKAESRRNLDEARDKVGDIKAEIYQAEAAVTVALARLKKTEFEVELRTIKAPMDGEIVRHMARPGAGASTLNVSTLFTLMPTSGLIVRSEVEEAQIAAVTRGQKVSISAESQPDKNIDGRVVRIARVFGQKKATDDPNERVDERVIEVVITLGQSTLLLGQRVLVRFHGKE